MPILCQTTLGVLLKSIFECNKSGSSLIESVQRRATKERLGNSWSLSYKNRCLLVHIKSLWLGLFA